MIIENFFDMFAKKNNRSHELVKESSKGYPTFLEYPVHQFNITRKL